MVWRETGMVRKVEGKSAPPLIVADDETEENAVDRVLRGVAKRLRGKHLKKTPWGWVIVSGKKRKRKGER
jgi:hypothetical protein